MKSFLDNWLLIFPAAYRDRIFLVGGSVRDLLLGRESQDVDLVAALSREELSTLGFRLVETSSSVSIYFLHHPHCGKVEVTRIDDIADLADDLVRRDFTINAIAMTMAGLLIDPVAGQEDVKAGVLRTCSRDSFRNDPLRIVRAFRFEAGGWRMAPETEVLVREREWSASLMHMPVERFSNEMLKALTLDAPDRFFQLMVEFKTGKEFLPELFRMLLVPAGPLKYHPEGDLFAHSVQVLQRVAKASNDPMTRFCALFHDLGKLTTAPAHYPKHYGHESLGSKMAAEFCNRLRLPAAYARALACVCRLHGNANRWAELRNSTRILMAEQAIKADVVEILPLVSAADKPGALDVVEWKNVVRCAGMNTRELGVDQERLQAMPAVARQEFLLQKRVELLRKGVLESEQRKLLHE